MLGPANHIPDLAFEDMEDFVFLVVDMEWGRVPVGSPVLQNGDALSPVSRRDLDRNPRV
jgi:hypothetical protein